MYRFQGIPDYPNYQYELEQLRAGERMPELIQNIISKHEDRAEGMKKAYERYTSKCVPIYEREVNSPHKVNNSIHNDFVREIVNTKVGYFAGTPVSYIIEKGADEIQRFAAVNRLADLDAEATKYAAVCGYAARLHYVSKSDGKTRVRNVKPWEAILIGEDGLDEPEFAIRYYDVEVEDRETEMRVDFYGPKGEFIGFSGEGAGELEEVERGTHIYQVCPMHGYENDEDLKNDFDHVLTLIDGYNNTMSDVNSEIEAFRMAYLAFFGVDPLEMKNNPDVVQEMKNSGMFYFQDGQEAKFLTKTLQDTAIENHLNRLETNIYTFSQTPNLRDEAFGGNVSGVAARYKLKGLEDKSASFERKFKSSSVRMFEILATSAAYKSLNIDPYEVEMKFTRTFPQDMLDAAKIQTELKGNVSEETRLSMFPGIVDAKAELEKMQEEQAIYDLEDGEDDERGTGERESGAGNGSAAGNAGEDPEEI